METTDTTAHVPGAAPTVMETTDTTGGVAEVALTVMETTTACNGELLMESSAHTVKA